MAWLVIACVAFVGSHMVMAQWLRRALVRALGEKLFTAAYVAVSLLTFGLMVWAYRALGRQAPLWSARDWLWLIASVLMWIASILFVGSLVRNPAFPGARGPSGAPRGVFMITRHPMNWSFATWAIVHAAVVATPKALVLDAAILILALVGSALQDRKKAAKMGESWREWEGDTAFIPFSRGAAYPGAIALIGGTIFFFLVTWLHPVAAGFWRWIG